MLEGCVVSALGMLALTDRHGEKLRTSTDVATTYPECTQFNNITAVETGQQRNAIKAYGYVTSTLNRAGIKHLPLRTTYLITNSM